MSKADTWENGLLKLVFNNDDFTGLGDGGGVRGSSSAGSLYISLHTADPGEAGNQSTSEVSISSYARVAVARSSSGWNVSGSTVENVNAVTFPEADGSATITHFGIGTDADGSGKLLYKGQLTNPLSVSSGVTPSFAAGDITVSED